MVEYIKEENIVSLAWPPLVGDFQNVACVSVSQPAFTALIPKIIAIVQSLVLVDEVSNVSLSFESSSLIILSIYLLPSRIRHVKPWSYSMCWWSVR